MVLMLLLYAEGTNLSHLLPEQFKWIFEPMRGKNLEVNLDMEKMSFN